MSAALHLRLRGADLDTPGGRPLIRGLELSLSAGDHAALIGRNGVGKSTLLEALAGQRALAAGQLEHRGAAVLVAQHPSPDETAACLSRLRAAERDRGRGSESRSRADVLRALAEAGLPGPEALPREAGALSGGELRKLHLVDALLRQPALLLLDEPSEDLDVDGRSWLLAQLTRWPGALVVCSHRRELLMHFQHFFVLAEPGCRYLPGRFAVVEAQLAREEATREQRYIEGLAQLARDERRNVAICRRRQRKKNLGRLHELGRCTSRAALNTKRSYAQESQARVAKIRASRLADVRGFAKAMRRALRVELPLSALTTQLPPAQERPLIQLEAVTLEREGRGALFDALALSVGRERVAITGANGCGKTSLLQVMLGELEPSAGRVRRVSEALGVIAQGAMNWACDESLLELLLDPREGIACAPDRAAQLLVAHRFPLALAERSLAELSPGERVRAALICLMQRRPAVELLVLDEPSNSLDFVGRAALEAGLRAWPGGVVIASHDRAFVEAVGVEQWLDLG